MARALTHEEIALYGGRAMDALRALSSALMALGIEGELVLVLADNVQLRRCGTVMSIAASMGHGGGGHWSPYAGTPFWFADIMVTSRPRYVAEVLQSEGFRTVSRVEANIWRPPVVREDVVVTWEDLRHRVAWTAQAVASDSVKGA